MRLNHETEGRYKTIKYYVRYNVQSTTLLKETTHIMVRYIALNRALMSFHHPAVRHMKCWTTYSLASILRSSCNRPSPVVVKYFHPTL
jgi:hypothetical protein